MFLRFRLSWVDVSAKKPSMPIERRCRLSIDFAKRDMVATHSDKTETLGALGSLRSSYAMIVGSSRYIRPLTELRLDKIVPTIEVYVARAP
jgi:hypothetical protein